MCSVKYAYKCNDICKIHTGYITVNNHLTIFYMFF